MPRIAGPKRAAGVSSYAPTRELGTIMQGVWSTDSMQPWTSFVDEHEQVPELVWPRSIKTISEVRSDSQVAALLKGTFIPLRRMRNWSIDPNGVTDNARVERLADTLNLPIKGEPVDKPKGRLKRRFIFSEHLRLACLGPVYGHNYFEQSGFIDDDGLWSLKRLAERPPWTIADFRINPQDGGLISIVQNVGANGIVNRRQGGSLSPLPELPIDNLVGYVWDKEGANWAGRSMLRDIYKNWVLKDQLMRIDTINHGRAGGVPYIEGHPDASTSELAQLSSFAQQFRVGDVAGGAVPYGAKVNIARAGNTDVVGSVKYHDEAMARCFMLMVLMLGMTSTGSRSLGSTFTEFWSEGVNTVADWFADHFNEYVIEDYWDWNYGEDEKLVPKLIYEADPELNATDIAQAIKVGAIQVDDELEDAFRKEWALPNRGTPRPNEALNPAGPLGQTPDGSDSPGTKSTTKKEGGPQLSQSEKDLAKSQNKSTSASVASAGVDE